MIETRKDNATLELEFYEKDFKFSYSSLNTLLTAPRAFYKNYVLLQKESIEGKHLLEGTLIHYLVLENEGFDDKFIVASEDLPGDANITLIKYVFENFYKYRDDETLGLIDFRSEILDYLKDINKHQNLKDTKDGLGDDKRMAKVADAKSVEYFEFLKSSKNKTIIDSKLLDKCTQRAEVIKANAEIRELLGLDIVSDGVNYGVYNELPLDIPKEFLNLPFGFKGILDNMVIDVKKKLIRINDFKTTGKSLVKFKDSVEFWNYWVQAVMYYKLVLHFLKDHIKEDWRIEFRFIVFDTHDQLYPFFVTSETMATWTAEFDKVIKDALFHYEQKDYSLPYAYATGAVKL